MVDTLLAMTAVLKSAHSSQETTGGVLGRDIKILYQDLVDHGCSACGSVPTGLPAGINDVSRGMLTLNFVSDPDCFGVCSKSSSKKRETSLFKREGINCEGSSNCGMTEEWVVSDINGWMGNVDDDRLYNNGEHIVCVGDITFCSFPRDTTGGVLGKDLKVLMNILVDHGCTVCGSVPTGAPAGINDVSQGMLTINYVEDDGGCSGVC